MKSILQKIIESSKKREKDYFQKFDLGERILLDRKQPIDIIPLMDESFFYIFEIKRASPSLGIILYDFEPIEILKKYELAGASAISIITEPEYFFGSKIDLMDTRDKTDLPLLRKDFIIHPSQVYESYNLGADFLLLIAACLSAAELKNLYDLTLSLKMNALIEIHNEGDLEKAMLLSPELIGINNRDLNTFSVDLETSFSLKKLIPENIRVISESGIKTHEDVLKLKDAGFSGVLIGESVLKAKDILQSARKIING